MVHPSFSVNYARNLPHMQPPSCDIFCTFRLFGSLPKAVIQQLSAQRREAMRALESQGLNEAQKRQWLSQYQQRLFLKWDHALDSAGDGPRWLVQPAIAECVAEAICLRHPSKFRLIAFCIMPNHVHLIAHHFREDLAFYEILGRLKQYTSRQANRMLDRTGKPFWQDESFDHVVRKGKLPETISYVLNNPVHAGLVDDWSSWPYHWISPSYPKPK